MKNDRLITDWLSKNVSDFEKEELENVLRLSADLATPQSKSKDEAWHSILNKIEAESQIKEPVQHSIKPQNIILWAVGIAAMFMIGYFGLFQRVTVANFKTLRSQTLAQSLPDGSKVTLNASSKISYIESNWENNRNINLTGEAFFEVEKGSRFSVITIQGTVEVLGTSFNVFSRPDHFEVACVTGQVRVKHQDKEVILTPGQKVELFKAKGTIEKNLLVSEFNTDHAASWMNGEFYFDSTPLSQVIKELERQFGITIDAQTDVTERYYSGFFNKTNLSEALQLVFVPMGLNFEINNRQVSVQ